ERAYARARELCGQVGETPRLLPVLWGLGGFYLMRGKLEIAHDLGQQLLRLAHELQDPALLVEAHRALGSTLHFLGELALARDHLEQAIAFYDPQEHGSPAFLHYVTDPAVRCLSYVAWSFWSLGYPDQALKRSQEALTLAQRLSHPNSLAYA